VKSLSTLDELSSYCQDQSFGRKQSEPFNLAWFDSLPPLTYPDPQRGGVTGTDPDIMKDICQNLGMDLVFKASRNFFQMIEQVKHKINITITQYNSQCIDKNWQ